MAKVSFRTPDGIDKSYRLNPQRPTKIGRDPGNDVVLRDQKVSRHHAEVVFEKGFFVLHDLASANGSHVNGRKVRVAPLTNGAELKLGNSFGVFSEELPEVSDVPSGTLAMELSSGESGSGEGGPTTTFERSPRAPRADTPAPGRTLEVPLPDPDSLEEDENPGSSRVALSASPSLSLVTEPDRALSVELPEPTQELPSLAARKDLPTVAPSDRTGGGGRRPFGSTKELPLPVMAGDVPAAPSEVTTASPMAMALSESPGPAASAEPVTVLSSPVPTFSKPEPLPPSTAPEPAYRPREPGRNESATSRYVVEAVAGSDRAVIRDSTGAAVYYFQRLLDLVGCSATLATVLISITGIAAVLILLSSGKLLVGLLALLITVAFSVATLMLVPKRFIYLFEDEALSRQAMAILQESRFSIPEIRFSARLANGTILAEFSRSIVSQLGRKRWLILDRNGLPTDVYAVEESVVASIAGKTLGSLASRFKANYNIVAKGVLVGRIDRRSGVEREQLDLNRTASGVETRTAMALLALITTLER